ncbi:hypothetical protein [Kitasatospora azatica]|uniref:hypothetical protein n=1 Tax=Kitasatospora azatica TaxID=58347 RepID=UPI00056D900E|nr:hypothetical protein [Kitasatospora azatica]
MHRIRCEIDTEFRTADVLAPIARQWLFDGAEQLAGEYFGALLDSEGLAADGLRRAVPCGPPNALWGFFTVHSPKAGRVRKSHGLLLRKNLPRFERLLREEFVVAELAIYRLDDQGWPRTQFLRIGVEREQDLLDWVRFSAEAPAESLAAGEPEGNWLGLLRDTAAQLDVAYGQIGYERGLGRTEHEERVGPPLPSMTIPQSRTFLRGYEWATVVPKEIAARLGGADELRRIGEFAQAALLPSGAVLLQATATFDGFDAAAVERTWRAVGPALRPGLPKRSSAHEEEREPPSRIHYADLPGSRA